MIYNCEDRIGVYSVAKIFCEDLGWIFREQPISDFGIDGFVEITSIGANLSNRIPIGKLIGVQIKSGRSFFKKSDDQNYIFRGMKKHLNYWLHYSIPVIIILYDKETNSAYWESVNESTVHLVNKTFKINIPKTNLLNYGCKESLKSLAIYKGKHEYNLWLLLTSIEIIKLVMNTQLFLYIEIDGAPSIDTYYIALVITSEDDDCMQVIHTYNNPFNRYEYHFRISGEQSLKAVIKDTFPWIDLYLEDVEFTDEILIEQIANKFSAWFKEEDLKKEIAELKEANSLLRLSCYFADCYTFRLDLKINELAKAFLIISDFLNKEPITRHRVFS